MLVTVVLGPGQAVCSRELGPICKIAPGLYRDPEETWPMARSEARGCTYTGPSLPRHPPRPCQQVGLCPRHDHMGGQLKEEAKAE